MVRHSPPVFIELRWVVHVTRLIMPFIHICDHQSVYCGSFTNTQFGVFVFPNNLWAASRIPPASSSKADPLGTPTIHTLPGFQGPCQVSVSLSQAAGMVPASTTQCRRWHGPDKSYSEGKKSLLFVNKRKLAHCLALCWRAWGGLIAACDTCKALLSSLLDK